MSWPLRCHQAPGAPRCAGRMQAGCLLAPDYHLVWSRGSGCNLMLSKLVFTRDMAAIRGSSCSPGESIFLSLPRVAAPCARHCPGRTEHPAETPERVRALRALRAVLSGRWGRGPLTGGFGGTVGSNPLVQSAVGTRGQLAMAVCRQEPTCWTGGAGRRASSLPAGLISSLLTNPFTLEQAERDRAHPEASQCHSSPATTVSLLGAHRAPISPAGGWSGEMPPT